MEVKQFSLFITLTLCHPLRGHFLLLRRYPSQIPGVLISRAPSLPACISTWRSSITSQSLIICLEGEIENHLKLCVLLLYGTVFYRTTIQSCLDFLFKGETLFFCVQWDCMKTETDLLLTCLEWGDDRVLLLWERAGLFNDGDDFSRPLASDWLRLSEGPFKSISVHTLLLVLWFTVCFEIPSSNCWKPPAIRKSD